MPTQSEMNAIVPCARKESLIIAEIPDEVLVYDLKNNEAHCLNRPAAVVWANCDGKKTIAQVSQVLERELKSPGNQATVWMAIDLLKKRGLLQGAINKAAQRPGLSRRKAIGAIAMAGLALPIISSIVAPTRAQAASGLPPGACCQTNGECASGSCSQNAPACPNPPHKSCS
jgi:hypothetical protein